MPTRRALDVIQESNPCPADWSRMVGDDKRRFCTHCQKFVHDLTHLPADQAERLVCENAGNLCARIARDPRTGNLITLDYGPQPQGSRKRALVTIASVLGALGFSGTWLAHKLLSEPSPPAINVLQGDIVMPPIVSKGQ
jgi:hypothetical protein